MRWVMGEPVNWQHIQVAGLPESLVDYTEISWPLQVFNASQSCVQIVKT
jgi:hypothetical protein